MGLGRLDELVKYVSSNLLEFAFQDGIFIIWNLFTLLEKAKFWRSWSKLQSLVNKRTELVNMKKGVQTLLFEGKMEQCVNYLMEIKEEAEAAFELPRFFYVFEHPLMEMDVASKIVEEFKE